MATEIAIQIIECFERKNKIYLLEMPIIRSSTFIAFNYYSIFLCLGGIIESNLFAFHRTRTYDYAISVHLYIPLGLKIASNMIQNPFGPYQTCRSIWDLLSNAFNLPVAICVEPAMLTISSKVENLTSETIS